MRLSTIALVFIQLISSAEIFGADFSYLSPKPNAEHVSAHSRIIVRLSDITPASILNFGNSITVQSDGRSIPGKIHLAADKRTICFKPEEPFQPGVLVQVSFKATVDGVKTESASYQFRIADDESDVEPEQSGSYLSKPATDNLSGAGPRIMPNGVSVPSDFPHVTVTTQQPSKIGDGYIFLHNIRDRASYNIIFDNDGSPVWYERWASNEMRRDFAVQKNGIITMTSILNEKKYLGYDQDFNLINEFKPADGFTHDGHELQVLENGNYLIIGRRNVKVNASKYVAGGLSSAIVEETTVQEFTPDHQLIFNWPALDYLTDGMPYLQIDDPRQKFFRFPHFNAIDVDKDDGHLLISSRMLSEVTKVDRHTGDIIWRLGGFHSDFEFVNDPLNGFSCQHDIRSLGNGLYSIFDNGNYHLPPRSRGVVYQLDENKKTASLVWQYIMPSDETFSIYMGNMQQLPNGNYLINWAVGELPKVSEVTADGELVFEMNFNGNYDTYRSFRFPWQGVVKKPRLFVEQDDVSTILIFNKFGDQNVDYYKIYAGFEANPTTLLDTSRTTLKRFFHLIDKQYYYFRVTAVDKNGTESQFSNEHRLFVNYLKPGMNMLENGDFAYGDENWTFTVTDAKAFKEANDGAMSIFINDPGEYYDCVQLKQEGLALIQGKSYRLEFDASASENRVIEAFVERPNYPWNNYSKINPTSLRRSVQHFSYDFIMEDPSDYGVQLVFNCGAMPGDVTLDNVSLTLIDPVLLLEDLPEPWENTDVGEPAYEGTAGLDGNAYVVIGSGDGILGTSDEFHFAFQEMHGDVEFSAYIASIGQTHDLAKAGLMIRETLNDGAVNAMIGTTAEKGMVFQHRSTKNQTTIKSSMPDSNVPCWLKIKKQDDRVSSFFSHDGQQWTIIGSEIIPMDDVFYVGFAVTSHADDALCSSYFDDVTLNTIVDVAGDASVEPVDFALFPAYPNPFNPKTTITFSLPEQSWVQLSVYNVRGELAHQLVNEKLDDGLHQFQFDASNLSNGVYFYELNAKSFSGSTYRDRKKMTLIK